MGKRHRLIFIIEHKFVIIRLVVDNALGRVCLYPFCVPGDVYGIDHQ